MKKEILGINEENFTVKISYIFIFFFPIILLLGSAVINISIIIMNIFFLIHIFGKKNFKIFDNDIFYLLCSLWAFLIINTLLNSNFTENYSRSFGFIRFIILIFLFSYFLSYKNSQFKKVIFNFWTIIFIIISLDLFFEYIFGYNTLGFKNTYDGRLSGFMNDELKIGHWYFCFSLIVLSNSLSLPKRFYSILFLSMIISFMIGERANFIRLFIAIIFLLIIVKHINFKNIAILILSMSVIFILLNTSSKYGVAEIKSRYYSEFKSLSNSDTLEEFNNNNSYTPMFLNAYILFKENKLLGVGLGSYYQKSHETKNKYRKDVNVAKINGYKIIANTHPHQYHFEILALLGLPGYIFIFSFLLFFFFKSLSFYKTNKNVINLSSFLMIFVFCLPLLPTGSFFTTYGATMFWLNFSLMNLGNFKNINY
mgnify:CR=1 FL=1